MFDKEIILGLMEEWKLTYASDISKQLKRLVAILNIS